MTDITTKKDPAVLALEIRSLQQQAESILTSYIIEIGRRLCEAKAVLDHGQWGPWLKEQVRFSQSTAQNYMKIYERFGADQISLFGDAKSQTIGNLPPTKALKLIAVPEEDMEDFLGEHDVASMSTRELEQAIRERDEARKALSDAKEQARSELEAANAAELEKYQKKLDKAEKKASAAETKAQNLQIQVNKAKENAQVEAREEVRKELEEAVLATKSAQTAQADAEARAEALEKRLKMADSDTAVFQIYFQSIQEQFNRMNGIILKAETEKAEKYRSAIRALLASIGDAL